jgi:hypothetical protein
VTLAEVCTVAGLAEEAATALADARSLYEQKGNAAAAAQLRPASIDAADAAISPNPPS